MQNGLTINIHTDDKNIKELDKILSTFFDTNKHKVFELCVIDQTKSQAARAVAARFATRAFIRYALSANGRKPRYPDVVHIHSVDDVNKLAKGELPVKAEPAKSQQPQPAKSQQPPEKVVAQPVLSPEELQQENELLLLQLQQVQEELEEYYLKYQELKNSAAAVNG